MNTTAADQAYAQGYAQGWGDACLAFTEPLMGMINVLTRPDLINQPRVLCRECNEPMVIGQPARTVGRDVLGYAVWEHQVCPPKIWTGQAGLKTPPPAEDAPEQDAPEHTQLAVKMAMVIGQPEGPFYIVITDTDGQYIKRIDLDWDRFRPASAGHRLTENGWRVLPSAMLDPTKAAGWTHVGSYRWSAPVIPWDLDGPQQPAPAEPQLPPLQMVRVDSDSGSGYQEPLPKRIPGQALEQEQNPPAPLELVYQGQDDAEHTVTYAVTNATCDNDRGELRMVMTYDESGQWLRRKDILCLGCEKVTTV